MIPTFPNSPPALLEAAWQARYGLKLPAVREILAKLHAREDLTREQNAQVTLLEASLERSAGRFKQAEEMADRAQALAATGHPAWTCDLLLQQGLNRYAVADYVGALEKFADARPAAQELGDPLRAVVAAANLLLCLDNLGLPSQAARRDLDALMAEGSRDPGALQTLIEVLRDPLEVQRLREAFRRGERPSFDSDPTHSQGASRYYQLWLRSLPFFAPQSRETERQIEADIAAFAADSQHLFLKSYRFETLQGRVRGMRSTPTKWTEWADRLYLWTWRWLADPGRWPVDAVVQTAEEALGASSSRLKEMGAGLTSEDFQLLQNALGWILLFSTQGGIAERSVRRFLESVRPAGIAGFEFLEFEAEMLEALTLLKQSRDRKALDALAAHPLAKRGGQASFELAGWLKALGRPNRSQDLPTFVREWPLGDRKKELAESLKLDLTTGEVERWSRGKLKHRHVSMPLVQAIALLESRKSVPYEDLLLSCFGIYRMDVVVHEPKIFNLLSRIKALLPSGLLVQARGGHVWWRELKTGAGEALIWTRRSTHEQQLAESETFKALIRGRTKTRRSRNELAQDRTRGIAKLTAQGKDVLTRAELEAALGLPKASCHRMIQSWIAAGKLAAEGRGRSTRYRVLRRSA